MSMIQLSEPKTFAEMHAAHLARKARLSPAIKEAPPLAPPIPEVVAIAQTSGVILHLSHDEYCHILRMRVDAEPVIPVAIQNNIKRIAQAVSDFYEIPIVDMLSNRRTKRVVRPRQIACYLCRTLTTKSLPEIGRRLGGKDHTTVLHSYGKIARLRELDGDLDRDLTRLEGQLAG